MDDAKKEKHKEGKEKKGMRDFGAGLIARKKGSLLGAEEKVVDDARTERHMEEKERKQKERVIWGWD